MSLQELYMVVLCVLLVWIKKSHKNLCRYLIDKGLSDFPHRPLSSLDDWGHCLKVRTSVTHERT